MKYRGRSTGVPWVAKRRLARDCKLTESVRTGWKTSADSRSVPAQKLDRARGSFISHVITLASGAGVSQGVNALGTLILARLIAPADFGFFALFVTVITLVSVFGGARYELAIMLPEEDGEAANLAVVSVLAGLGIAAIGVVAIFFLRDQLSRFLGSPRIASWLWSAPVVLLLSALGEVARIWFGRTKNFHVVAAGRVSQSIGVFGGQLGLWALHVNGGMALIGGWLLGQGVWAGVMVGCLMAKYGRYMYSAFDASSLAKLAAKYKAFPIYRAPYSFVANGAAQLIFVILRFFCGLDVIGLYLLANRAVYLPVTLFGASMGQVFYQKAATEIKSDTLEPFVTRLVRTQIAIGAPILIFVAFEAPLLFNTFLGARWKLSGSFAAWLAFAGFLYLLMAWLVRLFDVCGRQRLALILQIAGGGTSLATMTLALHFGRSALVGIAAFTLSEVVASTVWVVCAYSIAGFRLKGLAALGKDFALAALPIAGAGFAIHHFLSGWLACGLLAMVTLAAVGILWNIYIRKGSQSASTVKKFRRYWSDKNGPLHRGDLADFHRACIGEIRNLFPADSPGRILEVGCGDGSGFPFLGVPATAYRGVDFSPRFVDTFRARYPEIDVDCAEGSSFIDSGARYDVIFSNEMVKQFDPEMLDRHLKNARRMMHPESVLILGSVPDREHRGKFDAGWYCPTPPPFHLRSVRLIKAACMRALGINYSGYWYTAPEIAACAYRRGFRACFVRSCLQPFTYHAVLFIDSNPSHSPTAAPGSVYSSAVDPTEVRARNQQSIY